MKKYQWSMKNERWRMWCKTKTEWSLCYAKINGESNDGPNTHALLSIRWYKGTQNIQTTKKVLLDFLMSDQVDVVPLPCTLFTDTQDKINDPLPCVNPWEYRFAWKPMNSPAKRGTLPGKSLQTNSNTQTLWMKLENWFLLLNIKTWWITWSSYVFIRFCKLEHSRYKSLANTRGKTNKTEI